MSVSRDPIIKLNGYVNSEIRLTLMGGRVISGKLIGFDHLNSVILDECTEAKRIDKDDLYLIDEGKSRNLGLVVVKSSAIETICGTKDRKEIENPFEAADNGDN